MGTYRIGKGFREGTEEEMSQWLQPASLSKVPEIPAYADTISARMKGILNHADHPISSGKTKGTNNLIRTIRRKAYGFRDTESFFLRIRETSRKPGIRFLSHTKV